MYSADADKLRNEYGDGYFKHPEIERYYNGAEEDGTYIGEFACTTCGRKLNTEEEEEYWFGSDRVALFNVCLEWAERIVSLERTEDFSDDILSKIDDPTSLAMELFDTAWVARKIYVIDISIFVKAIQLISRVIVFRSHALEGLNPLLEVILAIKYYQNEDKYRDETYWQFIGELSGSADSFKRRNKLK